MTWRWLLNCVDFSQTTIVLVRFGSIFTPILILHRSIGIAQPTWSLYLMTNVVATRSYDCLDKVDDSQLKEKLNISNLIEHPVQMKPPTQSDKKLVPAVMLTAKEKRKMRRQNRSEAMKEEQEKIRLGLLPPPEPKGNVSFWCFKITFLR